MARAPVDTRLTPELLQPQAQPVASFEAPGPSPLREFADALSKIDRPLQQFLDGRAEKQAEEDRIRGEAAFYSDNADDIAELVRRGEVPAQYSPSFVKGFKNAQGQVVGGQLRSKFNAAFDAWDGKNSEDPKAYDDFVENFLRENVDANADPEVLRTLVPQVRQLNAEGFGRYTDYRHKQTIQGSLDAHIAGANQDIDELNREGLSTEEGTNYPVVFQKIAEKRKAFVDSGGNPDDFDTGMVDAMSAKILTTRDPGLLAWFDQKVPGKSYTYGESPYGSKVKFQTVESLEVIARRSVTEDAQKQERLDKEQKAEAHRLAIDFLAKNPAGAIPDGLLAAGTKVDPEFKVHIEEWRKTLGAGYSDPRRVAEVNAEILKGGGQQVIIDAFRNGVFGRTEDLSAALALAKAVEDNKDRIGSVTAGPTFERFMKDLDIRTKGKTDLGDPIAGTSNEGYEAQYDFRRLVTEWLIANPNASPMEVEENVNKIGKTVLDRLVLPEGTDPNDPFAPAATYERDPSLSFENDFTRGTAPAPEAAPEPTPGETEQQKGELQDFLNGLTPEQRSAVDERAKSLGLTTEEFLNKGVLKGPEKRSDASTPDGTSVQPASFAAGSDLVAAQPRGLAALVSSSKRGSAPDLEHLRPRVVSGVTSLQQAWGKPLPIVSGFRGEERNRKAGGASKSQHIHGNAVDIDVAGMKPAEQVKLIRLASEQGFKGIGVYGNSIHLDYGGRRYWGPDHHAGSLPSWAKGVMAEHLNRPGGGQPGGQPPVFDQQTAMAFLDDALVEMPEDLSYSGSTNIEGDPVASRLGNFVGELEANGNYNAIYGKPDNTVDLGQFTLNQMLAMQVGAKAANGNTPAIGKYQFMYGTLRGLKSELGLSGNEKFTPKLQDRLFHTLLIRRGYNEYRAGKLSKRQFALRLSQEWAALPNPNTGRSYYAGDGVNKSRAHTSQVYAALGFPA